jgi:hypothetical protein
MSKIKKHSLCAFSWKHLHKSELPQTSFLGFQGKRARVLAIEKSELSNLWPIFGRVVHISIFNNFCNYSFLGSHKKGISHFISVVGRPNTWSLSGGYEGQNDATPIFKGMGPWRMAIYTCGFINFLRVLVYFIWTFRCLNSNLNCGYIKYTSNFLEGNLQVSHGVEPQKHCMSHLCTVHLRTLSTHCRLDLDFRWGP